MFQVDIRNGFKFGVGFGIALIMIPIAVLIGFHGISLVAGFWTLLFGSAGITVPLGIILLYVIFKLSVSRARG
jgi:hypothetical protein